MLRGELTGLRARLPGDTEILHAQLYDDVETRAAQRAGFTREGVTRDSGHPSRCAVTK
jgi:hypothetical protein